ncbi:MAG: PrsW family intramembrane metalloprotease [Flavobacteriales bacterium]|jgi:RsiW-degrading membrane proteinase PrsW (M82 family)|nr:PrsW family intramembrane metalloprotease [Flavobacteriales bacterium]
MVTLLFNGVGILLLFQFFKFKYLDFVAESHKTNFWKFSRHKYVLTVGAILIVTLGVVELILPDVSPLRSEMNRLHFGNYLGVSVAFAISVIWMIYLRKLDVFEPEEWKHIIIVFIMGCVTVWAVFPITAFMKTNLGFQLDNSFWNDFIYSWVGIGMVEELIKMVPLIIIVQFRKIVNEPYDFILYAAVSALGFAFIENAMYIERSDFYAINGRALMSTVAHMTFSSIIGYGLLIASCRRPGKGWHYIVGAFLVASLMHGFYDFWLINPIAKEFSGLSFVFFILTTHFWFTLKNRTINASYFYDETKRISNDSIRYFIILWMVVLLMVSTLLIGVFHGSSTANKFLLGQLYSFGFLIYYLGFSFSRFVIAPKAINACQTALEKVIPDEPTLKSKRN